MTINRILEELCPYVESLEARNYGFTRKLHKRVLVKNNSNESNFSPISEKLKQRHDHAKKLFDDRCRLTTEYVGYGKNNSQGGNRERNIANIFNWIVFYKIWPDLTIFIPRCEIRWTHRTSSSSKSETHRIHQIRFDTARGQSWKSPLPDLGEVFGKSVSLPKPFSMNFQDSTNE